MKSAPKKRTPRIANLTVKRRYLTEREVDRLMDCARKYGRYRVRPARPGSFRPSTSQWGAVARHCPIRPYSWLAYGCSRLCRYFRGLRQRLHFQCLC